MQIKLYKDYFSTTITRFVQDFKDKSTAGWDFQFWPFNKWKNGKTNYYFCTVHGIKKTEEYITFLYMEWKHDKNGNTSLFLYMEPKNYKK